VLTGVVLEQTLRFMLRDYPIHHNLIVQGVVVAERSGAVESNDGRALLIVRVRGWPGSPPNAIAVSPVDLGSAPSSFTPAQSFAEARESLPSKYGLHRDVWTPINRKHNLPREPWLATSFPHGWPARIERRTAGTFSRSKRWALFKMRIVCAESHAARITQTLHRLQLLDRLFADSRRYPAQHHCPANDSARLMPTRYIAQLHGEDRTALRTEPQKQVREAGLLRCCLECSTHLSTRRRGNSYRSAA
jgi:hypothetical protein